MCDYSLELYRSVPAVAGESYRLMRFGTGTMGFVRAHDCDTAACVAAGARLRLESIGRALQQALGIGATEDVVMTRQVDGVHRDGVRFADGREFSLQDLNAGLTATLVVPLPDLGLDEIEARERERCRDLVDA